MPTKSWDSNCPDSSEFASRQNWTISQFQGTTFHGQSGLPRKVRSCAALIAYADPSARRIMNGLRGQQRPRIPHLIQINDDSAEPKILGLHQRSSRVRARINKSRDIHEPTATVCVNRQGGAGDGVRQLMAAQQSQRAADPWHARFAERRRVPRQPLPAHADAALHRAHHAQCDRQSRRRGRRRPCPQQVRRTCC